MTLKTDIDRLAVDSGLLHNIVHGGPTATVSTEGGTVKSAAKVIADTEAAIVSSAGGYLASCSAQAGTATTQAGIATTQATNASASATAAAGSATAASGSATTASTQATAASGSAGTATTQAGIATTQATNASASAAAAAASAATMETDISNLSAGVAIALDIAGLGASAASDASLAVAAAAVTNLATSDANIVDHQLMASGLQAVLDFLAVVAGQVTGGKVQLAAGSAAEPSLWAAGDANTGVFFPAADAMALVTAGLERLRVDANGRLGIGTTAPSGLLDVADSKLRVRTAATPATAAAAGNAGEICWDASYVYVCTATNTWKRAALTTW